MQQQITVKNTNQVMLIRLGPVVLGDSSDVDLVKLLDEACQAQIIVNLSRVQLLCSTDVSTLIKAQRVTKNRNGQLRLCCLSSSVARLMSNLRIEKLFDIYETEEAAVASLRAGDPPQRIAS